MSLQPSINQLSETAKFLNDATNRFESSMEIFLNEYEFIGADDICGDCSGTGYTAYYVDFRGDVSCNVCQCMEENA